MSTVAPRMLVATRFGLGIKDPAWFEHRLVLLSAITASSLMAQDDQRFEWVLFIDPGLPEAVHDGLEQIIAPFGGRAHIWPGNREPSALHELARARNLIDDRGALLVGRIDDDDAWVRHTVDEVCERVQRWRMHSAEHPGYGLSFRSGVVWRMYDMIDLDQPGRRAMLRAAMRRYACHFTSISGFTYARVEEALRAVVTGHATVEELMRDQGYAIDVITTKNPMWLYCRHKQTDAPVKRGEGPKLCLTIDDLEERFGISAAHTRDYIANHDAHGYVRSLRMQGLRAEAVQELKSIDRAIAVMTKPGEVHPLISRRATLVAELEKLSANAIREPRDEGETK